MLSRFHAFETARPEGAAGLGPDLIDAADKARVIGAGKLGTMATAHLHEAASVDLTGQCGGDRPCPVIGQKGDIAVMGAKTVGTAGRAINV